MISDSMIRVFDSTTSEYPLINEIMARDVSWCMLDIAFSPNSQNFAYSTWSSCSKSKNLDDWLQNFDFDFSKPNFSLSQSSPWLRTAITTIIFSTNKIKFLYIFTSIFKLW